MPGSGAGRRQIRVGTATAPTDFASLWTHHIAPTAMPGTTVVAVRRGTDTPADGAAVTLTKDTH